MPHSFSPPTRFSSACQQLLGRLFLLLAILVSPAIAQTGQAGTTADAPLVIGNRTIFVFRAPLGEFSAEERAAGARKRIENALATGGEGWTSVKPAAQGHVVALDGKPMFHVLSGDAGDSAAETPDELANRASRILQKVWQEAQESRAPEINLHATGKVLLGAFLLLAAITVIVKGSGWLRERLASLTQRRLEALPPRVLGKRLVSLAPVAIARLVTLTAWLFSLIFVFTYLTYSLNQFVVTRPAGENLSHSIQQLLLQLLHGITDSLPGIFISALIFLAGWGATRLSAEFFAHVESQKSASGILNAHTAPATRRVVNTTLWLFSIAMAYPYLPGSHTEAFKGVSVILGLMVSIGASGLVGQIASGVMLVYTRALLLGEYVRILDCEGTVVELGTFVTRLRTGQGEEISLPNALVLANVTRNFSREARGRGLILDTTISIGYDTPWRQVHALLLEAAAEIPEVMKSPAPFVLQSALADYYVAYKLVVYADSDQPDRRGRIASDLHAAIQDAFNRRGVQIMSPHYFTDPRQPKTVPEADWYPPPAKQPE